MSNKMSKLKDEGYEGKQRVAIALDYADFVLNICILPCFP